MIAAVVEMLMVPSLSPPVPTTSRISRERVSASSGGTIDLSRKARANAAISSGVSPFFASAARKSALRVCRNFLVGEMFDGHADLGVVERLRAGELLDEFF